MFEIEREREGESNQDIACRTTARVNKPAEITITLYNRCVLSILFIMHVHHQVCIYLYIPTIYFHCT